VGKKRLIVNGVAMYEAQLSSAFCWSKKGNPPDRFEPVAKSEEIFRPRAKFRSRGFLLK